MKKEIKGKPSGVRIRPTDLEKIKKEYGSLQKFVDKMIEQNIKESK